MITEKTKDLFKFIDFLHSNIDNFKQYDEVTNELNQLDKERDTLTPENNFKDKITFDEVQDKIKDKFQVIEQNIMQPIKLKATELKICDQTKEYFRLNFDLAEIDKTKKEFNKQDLSEILAYKNKYIEFKTETKSTVWQKFFFVDFEKTLSILFDYFNENNLSFIDEIKKYTTKKNQSSISDAQKKEIDKKYFPNGFFYKVKTFDFIIYSNSKRFDEPFESLQEYEKAVKNLRHRNALSFFHFIKNMNEADFIKEINNQYLDYTLENTENAEYWLKLTYDLVLKGFSVAGKIEDINLRGAFINWYNEKIKSIDIKQPQQIKTEKLKKTLFEFIHNVNDKENFLFELKNTFPTEKGKSIRAIINILENENIFIYGAREFTHLYDQLKVYFNRDIGTYQSIQDVKVVDTIISDTINKKLNPLIIKHKTT